MTFAITAEVGGGAVATLLPLAPAEDDRSPLDARLPEELPRPSPLVRLMRERLTRRVGEVLSRSALELGVRLIVSKPEDVDEDDCDSADKERERECVSAIPDLDLDIDHETNL